ncbi:MAG: homoserine kinase [Clostridia bacterium]|nr:homoserine kinase [Clostridia bacterium]
MDKIKVKVPATSANLGSGFDCVGIAYELYNVFEFEKIDTGLEILGCEPKYATEENLAYVAYRTVCKRIGVNPSVRITILETNVPNSRGLGSSATFICAGAFAAYRLHENALSHEDVLEICTEIEGHPDNIAPALYGSLCSAVMEKEFTKAVKFNVSEKIHFTVLIPDFQVKTEDARHQLPEFVERNDAVYNMSRVALLPYAFENGDFDLLRIVTKDRIHQKYRKKLFKNIDDIKKAAYSCGAESFVISGAGSTCLCMSQKPIANDLNKIIKNMPNGWIATELKISKDGTKEV